MSIFPIIKNFQANNIRNAIILNSLYFTIITVVTVTLSNFFTQFFIKKEKKMKLKGIKKDKIDSDIKKTHDQIAMDHFTLKHSSNKNIDLKKNIKRNEAKIIELIKLKYSDITDIKKEINLNKLYITELTKILYKEPDVAIRTKLINNIINLENKINDYNKYIDTTVKVSIRFKSELIILITFFMCRQIKMHLGLVR